MFKFYIAGASIFVSSNSRFCRGERKQSTNKMATIDQLSSSTLPCFKVDCSLIVHQQKKVFEYIQ
jgi:hypothetical protein